MAEINPMTTLVIDGAFDDADSNPVDPTVVKIEIVPSGGDKTTYVYGTDSELVKDSVGRYHADYVVPAITTRSKRFAYRWIGSGNLDASVEGEFLVQTRFL
jgi:hypothetical protein